MKCSIGSSSGLIFAMFLACAPATATAQADAGAQSTLIDPSIRAAGMGRAGVAVFWGDDRNDWVNPSLLGYQSGISFARGKTQLVPELADDVYFRSSRLTLGGWGIGLSISGRPTEGIGSSRLDYGKSTATDIDGNPIGEFQSFEEIEAMGVGVSIAQFLESTARLLGADPPMLSRFADVSLGHAWKSVWVDLAPPGLTLDGRGARGSAKQKDHGLLARFTPYNSIDFPGGLPGLERLVRVRLDASYGTAAVNYDNDVTISFIDEDQADPFAKDSHWGWAVHADLALPDPGDEYVRFAPHGWIARFINPILSFGATWEHAQYAIHDVPVGQEINLQGWEVTVANIFTLRQGHVEDPTGTVIGDTSGWSVGLRFARIGGFRYDHADVPQSIYLDDVTRNGFTVFIDPLELSRRMRAR